MSNLQLSLAISSNPRTRPIIDGRVKPDGIEFTKTVLGPAEMFWRQLRFAEFDVSEISMSELMMIRSRGDDRFVGIPVFTTRRFYHTMMLVRQDAGIAGPADLKGKRVGVPEYVQTAALWTRGVLENEFGIAPKDMTFFMERLPARSHAGAIGFVAPPGITINQIPPEKSIASMMLTDELDACMAYFGNPGLIDRSDVDLPSHPDIKRLFADTAAEALRYYKNTGIYPINHGMAIKRAVFEHEPWAVINILKAFNQANAIAEAERSEHAAYHFETGLVPPDYRKALGTRLITHGLNANRAGALYQTFPACEARRILRRLEFHYVPKHASWLNMVEIEIGVLRSQCLDRRIGTVERLASEIAAWERQRNTSGARIKWLFTSAKARAKMGRAYPEPASVRELKTKES